MARIGHEETRLLLLRDGDPARPAPEVTFADRYTLEVGGERVELAWHGPNHSPDNIYIHFPGHDTLRFINVVNAGWVPIYNLNLSEDVIGYMGAPAIAVSYPWTHFICGHLGRLATRDDVAVHQQYVEVLDLSVDDALQRFAERLPVAAALRPVSEVGLGYLRLGEPTPSLSGGESQRLRIATRLRSSQRGALYVFDEPSTGLHPLDVATLVGVFDRLLEAGATIIVSDRDLTANLASARIIGRQALTGPALAHGYDTAFWWTAGLFADGAVIGGTQLRRGRWPRRAPRPAHRPTRQPHKPRPAPLFQHDVVGADSRRPQRK